MKLVKVCNTEICDAIQENPSDVAKCKIEFMVCK